MLNKIAIAATLALLSSVSMAGEAPNFYVGADTGRTRDDGSQRETSMGVFAGYRFDQRIALEAGYRRLVENDIFISSEQVDAEVNQISLSVLGTMPLNSDFSLYGRLGYNRINASIKPLIGATSKGHADRVLYGIGAAYRFSKVVSMRLELQKPASDFTNLSLGVAFHF
jgi:OOP family OmpA-OmpF porin